MYTNIQSVALRSGALSTGQNLRACQNGRAPPPAPPAPPACRCPLRGPGRPLRRAPGPALDLSSWKSWEHSPDTSALDSPILAQSRRDAHLNTRSGAAASKPAMAPIRRDRRDRSRWTIAKDLRGRRAKVGHLAMGCNTVLVHARARRSPGPAPRPGAARTMDKNHLFCPDATHFQQDLLRKRASRASDPDSFFSLSQQKLYEF